MDEWVNQPINRLINRPINRPTDQSGAWDSSLAREQTVLQAVSEDLSAHSRAALKHLAHEVAGAVVFDLGE